MKQVSLENLISENYEKLSANDHHIWRYISNNKESASNLSINVLAERCAVSRTTLMRFAQKIGLTGYGELKTYLRWEISRVSLPEQSIVTRVCENNVQTIRHYEKMDFTSISDSLYHAHNIFIYGTGSTQREVGTELKRMFLSVNLVALDLPGEGELVKSINLLNEGDVLFAISKSGQSEFVAKQIQKLRGKGVIVISLTSNHQNKLAAVSDYNLPANIEKYDLGSTSSFETMVQMFLVIEILFAKFIDR